ncbi:MAG: hypothetical protein AAGD22_04755 [Verrucomicrobiota bacterium]
MKTPAPRLACLFLLTFFFLLSGLTMHGSDFATPVMNATFKLFHPASTSTCFLVQRAPPDKTVYLVTAGHSLTRTKGETATLVLRKPMPDGSFQRLDHTIAIRSDDTPLWINHPEQDVAVLPLSERLPFGIPALNASVLASETRLRATKIHIGSPLLVLTFPQRFEANGAGFPVARQGIFASPPLLPIKTHPTFLADFTTFAGDSGGPVFVSGKNNQPLVVGVVVAQHHYEDKVSSEYEERTIRHPLGMGTVVHSQYVRETLALTARKSARKTPKTTGPLP